MVNYKNGRIYKLVNSIDDKIYVGSTTVPLSKRKVQHKWEAKRSADIRVYKHLNAIGWDNVDIVLIEQFSCNNKEELHKRERECIEELKPELNSAIPARSIKEWQDAHKVELKQKNKDYYNAHKNEILAKVKQYTAKNREKKLEYLREYRKKLKIKSNM